MKSREEAVLETLRGMQRFLDDNSALLDGVSSSGARKDLDDIVAQLLGHAVTQVGGHRTSQAETAKQQQLRLTLRFDHMRPIAEIARQKLRKQPEFTKLSLPPDKFKGAKLTTAARDMANAAEKYTDVFVQAGLAADFVAQLRTAADLLDESIGMRGKSWQQRGGATTGLETETTQARAVIRVLDSLVRPKLGGNDALLRQWDIAKHIHRARKPVSAPSTDQASQQQHRLQLRRIPRRQRPPNGQGAGAASSSASAGCSLPQ